MSLFTKTVWRVVALAIAASCLAGCGVGMSPAEQAAAAQVCTKAGMGYAIMTNDLGWVMAVNCTPPTVGAKR